MDPLEGFKRFGVRSTGGPRDQRFAESTSELIELLVLLANKSQLLDSEMLACYQHRVDVLTDQVKDTMQREGILV
jgi:hypothetical protein